MPRRLVLVEGYDEPLPLFTVTLEDGSTVELAQVRRVGLEAQMVDPDHPDVIVKVNINDREPVEEIHLSWSNYIEPLARFNFLTYLKNSVVVTVVATAITLIINSMAAFALSKYQFRGRDAILVIIIGTLMIPVSVVLVPVFLVITQVGWVNNLWGVIIPGAATPTGVFLLRQYMLTLPDELLASARIDGASEWRIYWQIVLPLSAPALAVLAIFSIMWRWNDFLWPLIVLSHSELFTLQVGLECLPGRAEHTVAVRVGHDCAHAAAHHGCLCFPAAFHHHRYCDDRDEVERAKIDVSIPLQKPFSPPLMYSSILIESSFW